MNDKPPPDSSAPGSAPEPSPDDQVTQDLSGSRWESTDQPAPAEEPAGNAQAAIPPPAAGPADPVAPVATQSQRPWWRRTPAMIGGVAAAALLVGMLGFGVGYAVGDHGDDDGYGRRGDGDFGRGHHGPGGFGGQQGQGGQLPPIGPEGQLDQDSDNSDQSDGSTESGIAS